MRDAEKGLKLKSYFKAIVYEYKHGDRTFYVEEVLDDGGLSSKQMLIVGEHSKPSFLKKYKKIAGSEPDTDVAAQSHATSQSSPGNHVQDAGSTAGNIIKMGTGEKANLTGLAANGDAGTFSPMPGSEAIASDNSISSGGGNVNRNIPPDTNSGNGYNPIPSGAKLSQFWENTLQKTEEAANAPEDVRQPLWYMPKSERQSLAEAAARLSSDRQKTVESLIEAEAWSGVQTDAAAAVYDMVLFMCLPLVCSFRLMACGLSSCYPA